MEVNQPKPFFAELSRRKVFRAVAIYIAIAWGLIEFSQEIVPRLGLPPSTVTILIGLFVVGIPITAVLSALFDVTFSGIKTMPFHKRFVLPLSLFAAVLFVATSSLAYYMYVRTPADDFLAPLPEFSTMEHSIAVLPFVNSSQNADNDFLADGIAFTVLTQLAKVGDLNVIAKASSFMLRGTVESPQEIGRRLRVGRILQGVVQEYNGQLRVSAELVDTQTGQQVWAEVFDTTADDFFKIQDDISLALAQKMEITVSGGTSRALTDRSTVNEEAYQLYLLGKFQFDLNSGESMVRAYDYYRQAVEIDPNYSLAWVGLADSLSTWVIHKAEEWSSVSRDPEIARADKIAFLRSAMAAQHDEAMDAIDKALELKPNMAAAYAALGNWQLKDDKEAGLASLERAFELDPKYARAHFYYARVIKDDIERGAKSKEHYERAAELDPLNLEYLFWAGVMYGEKGEPDKSLAGYRLMFELDPDNRVGGFYPTVASHAAIAASMYGMHAEAVKWNLVDLARDPNLPENLAVIGSTFLDLGDAAEGEKWLAKAYSIPEAMRTRNIRLHRILDLVGHYKDYDEARRLWAEWYGGQSIYVYMAVEIMIELAAGEHNRAGELLKNISQESRYNSGRHFLLGNSWCFLDKVELAALLLETGDEDKAKQVLAEGKAIATTVFEQGMRTPAMSCVFAQIEALQGNTSLALDHLEQAVNLGLYPDFFLHFLPSFDSLRDEPRFRSLLKLIEVNKELELEKVRALDWSQVQL